MLRVAQHGLAGTGVQFGQAYVTGREHVMGQKRLLYALPAISPTSKATQTMRAKSAPSSGVNARMGRQS